ncbi:MAG: putative MPP superfamily phosphohydrolase [Saprospiraceae bacterium]|jgi:predicted MPP superfamily phosphohydrolase|tara:strand:- start:978 stop:2237 length:1260 start_codon:yes stop_codon:yes gene_type:complete
MSRLGFLVLLLIIYLGFDIYTFYGLSSLITAQSFFCSIYWAVSAIVLLGFYKVSQDLQRFKGGVRPLSTNLLLGFGFAVFVGKILLSGLLFTQDLGRLVIGALNNLSTTIAELTGTSDIPPRHSIITMISVGLAAIPFFSMLYGMTVGKYRYVIDHVKLSFPDLPNLFDGFKVIQISDIHSGTFDSVEQVRKGIDLIMAQEADIILFTGDLVNSNKNEIDPYIDTFAHLSAPYGMYSVMGNHDYYGMYKIPKGDHASKSAYLADFNNKHKRMGFEIMNNTSKIISKGSDSIRLVGVENWGAGPFPKKGSLSKALEGVSDNEFSILMSHDPTHWDHHVLKNPKQIHLTLAGHTHGMQFGINFLGIRWSPVKYRYSRWMGLYKELDQYLYVNRGFGFLAWPGRVGMRPEITLIELERKKLN